MPLTTASAFSCASSIFWPAPRLPAVARSVTLVATTLVLGVRFTGVVLGLGHGLVSVL